jgi:predicted dehydrogenase
MKRRDFLKTGLTGATLAGPARVSARSARVSAADKVTLVVMGVRGRGLKLTEHFAKLPDVNVAAICDVDQNVVGPAMKVVEQLKGRRPPLVEDIRRVLDDRAVDAVVVATPIHWHAPATILACAAGKDVYVEKPVSHNVREGRLMVEAARKHGRIVQVGTQARSRPVTIRFVDYVRSGKLGTVRMAKVWNCQMRSNIGHKPDEPVPAGVNYDLWTGPVPMLPFNRNRFHGTVNWHWHYGAGDLGNDGVHWIDVARWALGLGFPQEVGGMGRKLHFDDDQQTPDTQSLAFSYPDRMLLYEMRLWTTYRMNGGQNGVEVYGTGGKAVSQYFDDLRRYGFKVFDEQDRLIYQELEPHRDSDDHYGSFVECVRTRRRPNADIEEGHLSAALCHLGNIACRTGRTLKVDAAGEKIAGDPQAAVYLSREYRDHWSARPLA